MKLLMDEMWSPEIAIQLRRRGHDVIAVVESAELRTKSDDFVFAFALTDQRAVVTENVSDYRQLAAREIRRGHTHPGIVLTSNRRFPRSDPRTTGRLVVALDALLYSALDVTNREHWLS